MQNQDFDLQIVADLVMARVLTLRQVWVQGQPGIPDHIVAEAQRAFLNDRGKIWKNVASSVMQARHK